MSKSKKSKSSNGVYIILLFVALLFVGGVGWLIYSYASKDVEIDVPVVDNRPQATQTPTYEEPSPTPNIEIEQDRTLKFDRVVTGVPKDGVVSEDSLDALFEEHGDLPVNMIEEFETNWGTSPRHSYLNNDLILFTNSDQLASLVDGSTIYVFVLYSDDTVDDMVDDVLTRYPGVSNMSWKDHQGVWEHTIEKGLSHPETFGLPVRSESDTSYNDPTIVEGEVFHLVGMGYLDFSEKGYEKAFYYITVNPYTSEYMGFCQVDAHEGLMVQLMNGADKPDLIVNHFKEVINNMLVIIE